MTLVDEAFCYLTTRGRVTGRDHEIEIWFATDDGHTLYLMAGGRERSDWVKNLQADPRVSVRIGDRVLAGSARVVEEAGEDDKARRLLLAKYQKRSELAAWGASALPVAIVLGTQLVE